MFSQEHRLGRPAAKLIAKRGRALSGAALRIKWLPAHYSPSKVAVVVGLTVDKRATVRNRIKRQLREALRPLLLQLRAPTGLMVFAHKPALGRSFKELAQELGGLLRKAGLL